MPSALTYPGVYIEELPSGSHTITGVSTSVTAFVGRCARGPVDEPTLVTSFAEFERIFGGLWKESQLSFAVRDFYLNGGTQALIVRVYEPSKATITIQNVPGTQKLILQAISKGVAGNGLQVEIEDATSEEEDEFNLIITDTATDPDTVETFENLSIGDVIGTINNPTTGSTLVSVVSNNWTTRPSNTTTPVSVSPLSKALSKITLFQRAKMILNGGTTGQDLVLKAKASKSGILGNGLRVSITHGTSPAFTMAITDSNNISFSETHTDVTLATIAQQSYWEQYSTVFDFEENDITTDLRPAIVTNHQVTVDTANRLFFEAANPGTWSNNLLVSVNHDVSSDIATNFGLNSTDLFNLIIKDNVTGIIESFLNVTVVNSPRRVDKVLSNESNLIRTTGSLPALRPDLITETAVLTADKADEGKGLDSDSFIADGYQANKKGFYALEKADIFNLLCIPPYRTDGDIDVSLIDDVTAYCKQRRAFFIIDSPVGASGWTSVTTAKTGIDAGNNPGGVGSVSENAAVFFPRLKAPNPLRKGQIEDFAACGAIAGIFARTDAQRGIWKAPAGLEANIAGATGLTVSLTEDNIGQLNPKGVNCLRSVPAAGLIVWGSRTRKGSDSLSSEWKYIPVRRLALYLEESLYRGMQWAVFEPNDEPLWRQISLTVDSFMNTLFRQGAFQGSSPKEAYFVKCDKETTTQTDINNGIVNILVGFAPLKPAEFVVIKLQQLAGQA